jgi:hypothetical protein
MRFALLAGFGLAGLGTFVVAPAAGAAAPRPPLRFVVPQAVHAGQVLRARRNGRDVTAGGCTSNYSTGAYFVGIPGVKDVAGGNVSGVLSGYANEACDVDDAIGSGYLNIIGATGDGGVAQLSFIGSGTNNAITGEEAFIGAGSNNGVSGKLAFVGAGNSGQATGNGSFVGAGIAGLASGFNAFVGAGQDNAAEGEDSFAGGGLTNYAVGDDSVVGGGNSNTASNSYSFVGGGSNNTANADDSVVVGGGSNSAGANSVFVGGGAFNKADGAASVIVGGTDNMVSGNGSFIGAGDYQYLTNCFEKKECSGTGNTVAGTDSFIGAGDQNTVSASEAFTGGGSHNSIAVQAAWGTIGGGDANTVSGKYATIPGGSFNTASGLLSFAAGYHADATQTGSFVWSDYVSGSSLVKDSAADQFVVRASGGTYVYSSENLKAGVKLAAGSGTWASLSDRGAKTDIAPLNDAAILAKVATLPVSTWRYKTESSVRHVGPMAQDFYAAFGVGEDDRHITSIDEDGVALAAIKALHAENASLRDRLAALEKKVAALSTR